MRRIIESRRINQPAADAYLGPLNQFISRNFANNSREGGMGGLGGIGARKYPGIRAPSERLVR